ncbi:TetR family transcriptional regulator [Skermania sp. ID1734]|uniref:TetR/AcrR family transcriptional regulator n=1 Tax=Skermania sp. ID1734 TaxID=2597516 RepID=UPI00117D7CA8|nr:TetR family transcriptional regulator [Skermania sp. ID1734]TSD99944.1 TetR family transcriptional regulator [Skermania sp. ID1734]
MHASADVTTTRRRPRDRRETIVRVATAAFAEHGYHAASMAGIATEVGISSTALYRHFRNKQDLLGQCLLTGLDTALSRLSAARSAGDSVLHELTVTCLELRGLPRLWQLEVRNLSPADRVSVLTRVVRLCRLLRESIAAQRPDLDAADVELLAWCVLSVAVSPSYHRVQLAQRTFVELLDGIIASVVDAAMSGEPDGVSSRRRTADAGMVMDSVLRPERMVSAAARLFNSYGYAAVGIEDIGAAVGVSGPALYHHFASKADMLNEIIERNDQWIKLYISRALTESDTASDALRQLTRYFVNFAADEPDVVGTSLSEAGHLPAEQAARYQQAHREGIKRWARMLVAVRPELSLDLGRAQVQALTSVVIDAVRNPRLAARPDLRTSLIEVCDQILGTDAAAVGLREPG